MDASAETLPLESPPQIHVETSGRALARNAALSLTAESVPMLVALISTPLAIRELGTERFGILAIAWAVLTYLSLFDCGLGRATTKFIADALGRDEAAVTISRLLLNSAGFQILCGIIGGLLLAVFAPFLAGHVLKVPAAMVGEARTTFRILAVGLPMMLASNSFRGALEALQRFDLISYAKLPSNVLMFAAPALLPLAGYRLPGLITAMLLIRASLMLFFLRCCLKLIPTKNKMRFDISTLKTLLGYGGWVTVSSVLSPLMYYMDRFVIGSMLSVSAVAYYTAPFDMLVRFWVFPASLVATLFPAFSTLHTLRAKDRVEDLYARAIKSILLLLGPVLLLLGAFSSSILRLWLGPEFASKSTRVLEILAIGVLINSLAYVPYALLQGVGRPDITAKLHLLEFCFYAVLLYIAVHNWGIIGAAIAWVLRASVDAGLLFWVSSHLGLVRTEAFRHGTLPRVVAGLCVLGTVLSLIHTHLGTALAQFITTGLMFVLLVPAVWRFALDGSDRNLAATVWRKFFPPLLESR